MSRWTDEELAQALANNPALKLARQSPRSKPVSQTATVAPSPSVSPATPHKPRKDYKAELIRQCHFRGIKLEPEFKFHPNRKFRADWKVIGSNVLIEYEGGIFSSGKRGHSSISGIRRDIEKSNLAQILGYVVIRIAPDHVVSGDGLLWIEAAIEKCGILRRPW